jgi:hypothetical protein
MNTKLKSRKLWVTLWAMLIITYALVVKVNLDWFNGLAPILGGVIIAYVGGQSYIDSKGVKRNE